MTSAPSKRSLFWRLLLPYAATLAAVVVCSYAYSDRVLEELHRSVLGHGTLRQARLVGRLLPWDLRGTPLDARCAELAAELGARITVIAEDGTVLGDSDAPSASLANHARRPEVLAAFRGGQGHAQRLSASVNRPLYYSAWLQTRGATRRIIRLARPLSALQEARRLIRRAIWGGVGLAALLALWPALAVSRRVFGRIDALTRFSRAVTRGEEPALPMPRRDDLIGQLEHDLGELAAGLRQRLAAARDEHAKLKGVLRGMAEGVFVLDARGTVLLSNRRAERLFDLPEDAAVEGRPLIDLTRHPKLHALVREVMEGAPGGTARTREITLDAGQNQTLQATATPIRGPGGTARAFILVCHDISELKRLERVRSDFVANVSHELRTPLAAIRGYSETLLDGALQDPDNARRFLGIIERHATRLSRLVDDLLTLSDLELGRTEIATASVNPQTVVESACEVLRGAADKVGVALSVEVEPDLPELQLDADRTVEALVNLIDNAVKYTPKGGSVTVSVRRLDPEEVPAPAPAGDLGWVEFAVADTGAGIPSTQLPRLTERFYRVDPARSRELGGTGLGLAIVKHIVQAHGGRMRIESELHRGTTVHLFLPACRGDQPPARTSG